ncbi:MAG: TetR family transcriptional regulator [Frankiales bacterium]|nr:TetR family transcriptional regulator [Frankiales bacterium]
MGRVAQRKVNPPRLARYSLTRDEILHAALEICATEPLDQLTMKRVADSLGAGITSIYWHYRRKEDLLSALTDELFSRFSLLMPSPERGVWAAALHQHFDSYRSIMRTDPTMIDLLIVHGDHYSERSTTLLRDLINPVLDRLTQAGFAPTSATACYLSLSHYTRGVLLVDSQLRSARRPDGSSKPSLASDELRLANRCSEDTVPSAELDASFHTGLNVIIQRYVADLKR